MIELLTAVEDRAQLARVLLREITDIVQADVARFDVDLSSWPPIDHFIGPSTEALLTATERLVEEGTPQALREVEVAARDATIAWRIAAQTLRHIRDAEAREPELQSAADETLIEFAGMWAGGRRPRDETLKCLEDVLCQVRRSLVHGEAGE